MLRGIFFDLDDTLIGYADAERSALEAGCAFAARVNPAVNADALAEAIYDAYESRFAYGTPGYAELATLPVDTFRRRLTTDALASFGIEDPLLSDALVEAYAGAEEQALIAFPDTEATLTRLRPHVRMGLITNGPSAMQRAKLAALALDGYFDAIVVDTEFGHPKPDARIFHHAARMVGLSAEDLLFVGNSLPHDIQGAQAAGWTSVWINGTGIARRTCDPRPDYTIRRLSDLTRVPPVAQMLSRQEEPV